MKELQTAGFKLVLWHTPKINDKTTPPGEAGFAFGVKIMTPIALGLTWSNILPPQHVELEVITSFDGADGAGG